MKLEIPKHSLILSIRTEKEINVKYSVYLLFISFFAVESVFTFSKIDILTPEIQ